MYSAVQCYQLSLCLTNDEISHQGKRLRGTGVLLQLHKYRQGIEMCNEQQAFPSIYRKCSVVKLNLGSSASLLKWLSYFWLSDMDLQTRHMALSSLFTETLMMMNNSSVTTAESLRGSLRKWIDSKVHGLLAMPLLTAACQSLASVRHMAETTEACITAYFNEGRSLSWMPIKYK